MKLGTYQDGRDLNSEGDAYDVGGTPVTLAQMLAYDAAGQIEWATPELEDWAAEIADGIAEAALDADDDAADVKIDKRGAWCPHCGNRDSKKHTSGGACVVLVILFVTVIGILAIPFLPKHWKCNVCRHEWKA